MKTIFQHIQSWLEIYFWVPLALLLVPLTIEIHYFMVGRASGEDPYEFLVGMAPRFVAIILSITLVSVSRESFGSWLTREQKLNNPVYASIQAICATSLCIFFAYLLSR